jgi:Stage II sporulation protein E (SpoIIE)
MSPSLPERRAATGSGAHALRDRAGEDLLSGFLRRTHLAAPSDLARVVAEEARTVGALAVELYLIDYDLTSLVSLPASAEEERPAIPLAGTVAGRVYTTVTIVQCADDEPGRRRLWLPLLDGTERLGAMAMIFAGAAEAIPLDVVTACERYAHLVATHLVTKGAYTDEFEVRRRRRTKTIASELIWELTRPLLFATDDLVLAGMLEPAYDNGGDALDYALNGDTLHLAIFDAMGHGLAAAGLATFALSAYRHSRRRGLGLLDTYRTMEAAIEEQFPDDGFVTGLIAQLDVRTGQLEWLSAGHPPPLVLRDDRRVHALRTTPATPLGVPAHAGDAVVARDRLEPGDLLLLYSDGLTEARLDGGGRMGTDGLRRFVEREAAAARPAPETLRRLRQAIVDAHPDELDDDATALMVEWKRGTETDLLPPTVGTD